MNNKDESSPDILDQHIESNIEEELPYDKNKSISKGIKIMLNNFMSSFKKIISRPDGPVERVSQSFENSSTKGRTKSSQGDFQGRVKSQINELENLHKCKLRAATLSDDSKLDLLCHLIIGSRNPNLTLGKLSQLLGDKKAPTQGTTIKSNKDNTTSETKKYLNKDPKWKFRKCSVNPFLPYVEDKKIHSDGYFRNHCYENPKFQTMYDSIFSLEIALRSLEFNSDKEEFKKKIKARSAKLYDCVKELRKKYLKLHSYKGLKH